MKKILLLIPVVFLCLSLGAEEQPEYWQREYQSEYTQGPDHIFYDMALTDNGNYFAAGYGEVEGYSSFIVYLNKYGSPLWKKIILTGYANLIRKIIMVDSESCILAGESIDSLFVMRINTNGEIIWQKRFSYSGMKVNDLIKTTNNNFLICGSVSSSQYGFVCKIDANGNLLWNKVSSFSFRKEYLNVGEVNKNYYLGGFQNNNTSDPRKYTLTKLDLNGNILKDTLFNFENTFNGAKFLFEINNICLFGDKYFQGEMGGNYIYKYNYSFQKIDSVKIQSENTYFESFRFVDFYKNIGYVITSRNSSVTNEIKSVVKIVDFRGNLIRVKSLIPSINGSVRNNFIYYKNNLIFGCGFSDYYNIGLDHAYCMKMDTLLNTSPTPIGIISENATVNNFTLHQNYPNPFNPSTKISYSLKKSSAIELKLFDINGRIIKIIESGFKPAGFYEINFSAEGLSSGVYFFSLYSGGILMDTKKAVLMK